MKIDYAPLLRKIIEEKRHAPADVVTIINGVAPGAVTRRAVDSWLADPFSRNSRPCGSRWIALLCCGMFVQGKINAAEQNKTIKVMNEISQAAALRDRGPSLVGKKALKDVKPGRLRISTSALNLFDQSLRSEELRTMRHSSKPSPSVQAIRKMKIRISSP